MGLARTMTLKASAAGLDLGGGKAVMIDDGDADTRDCAPGRGGRRVIDELGGAYITAEDIGTTTRGHGPHVALTRFVRRAARSERAAAATPPP